MSYENERAMIAFARGEVGKSFAWGLRDCNTLALQCLDILTLRYGYADMAVDQYSDEVGARAHQLDNPTIVDVLCNAGAVEGSFPPRAGDFLIVDRADEPWQRAHICVGSKYISADPVLGVALLPIRTLDPSFYILRIDQVQ